MFFWLFSYGFFSVFSRLLYLFLLLTSGEFLCLILNLSMLGEFYFDL